MKGGPTAPPRVARRDHVNRARNADHAAKTCEWFVYSAVKITRLHDHQRGQTFLEKFTRCAKVCGLFLLIAFRLLIGWAGKLRSRDLETTCSYMESNGQIDGKSPTCWGPPAASSPSCSHRTHICPPCGEGGTAHTQSRAPRHFPPPPRLRVLWLRPSEVAVGAGSVPSSFVSVRSSRAVCNSTRWQTVDVWSRLFLSALRSCQLDGH